MKKTLLALGVIVMTAVTLSAQLNPGDAAVDFKLKNVDGKMVSLSDYKDQKGVILVFTCNPCPFAKAYEQRIIELHQEYAPKGFPVVAIDPNDDEISPEDTFDKMKERAAEKSYPFPYLKDETQAVYKAYGATRTPHVYILENNNGNFEVAYIGTIDDNAMNSAAVDKKYVSDALTALLSGKKPNPEVTKAIGCTIKTKG